MIRNNQFVQTILNPNSLLLVFLVFIVFFVPWFNPEWHGSIYKLIFSCIFLLSAMAISHAKKQKLVVFVILLIALPWLSFKANLPELAFAARMAQVLSFGFIVTRLIMQTAAAPEVNLRVIADSISGYLLVGVLYAIVVYSIVQNDPGSYNLQASVSQEHDLSPVMYYTFVTYSSTGYGDITPQVPSSRALATLISVTGQLYIAVIIALLVGKFSAGSHPKN